MSINISPIILRKDLKVIWSWIWDLTHPHIHPFGFLRAIVLLLLLGACGCAHSGWLCNVPLFDFATVLGLIY